MEKAQKSQKEYYDCRTVTDKVHVGNRVFIYTPSEKKGKSYKFACPFVGPYRVLETYDNGPSYSIFQSSTQLSQAMSSRD